MGTIISTHNNNHLLKCGKCGLLPTYPYKTVQCHCCLNYRCDSCHPVNIYGNDCCDGHLLCAYCLAYAGRFQDIHFPSNWYSKPTIEDYRPYMIFDIPDHLPRYANKVE